LNIAILNFEVPWIVLASTSLIRGFLNKFPNSNIYFFVSQESFPVLQHNQKIQVISGYTSNLPFSFDLVVNLSPTIESSNFMAELDSKIKLGFIESSGNISYLNKDAEEYYAIMYNRLPTEKNIFQVIYKIAGLTWRGEGYDLTYYPKNRTNKRRTGIAVSHEDLRHFIKKNLTLSMSEICSVPIRKNIFKKMDEINRCMNIITDDLFILHASIALRKNVEFLDTTGLSTKIEFFGKGNYYRIKDGSWKL